MNNNTEKFLVGNTVKFKCTFVTFLGTKSDSTNTTFEVYSNNRLIKSIPLTEENHVSTGVYEICYVIPNSPNLLFRFVGNIEGFPEVAIDSDHMNVSTN